MHSQKRRRAGKMSKTFRRNDDNNYRDRKDKRKKSAVRMRENRRMKEDFWKDPTVEITESYRKRPQDSLHYR